MTRHMGIFFWLMIFGAAAVLGGCATTDDQLISSKAGASSAYASPATASAETGEPASDWTVLFDGSNLDHWRGYQRPDVPEGWRIEDGALRFDPAADDGGNLVTREMYGDFELELQWKISPGGNSGVFYRITEDTTRAWMSGPEMQVLDNDGHANGDNPLTRAGGVYGLYAPSEDVTRPVGEWNQVRITARGPHIEHWFNGTKIVEYTIGSDDWESRIAGTKFIELPEFGTHARGHLALQDHGNNVWFRDIRVRRLGAETTGALDVGSIPEQHVGKRRSSALLATSSQGTTVALFDGTDMEHWQSMGGDEPPAGWSIADSSLHFNPYLEGGGGHLVTKRAFGDFLLEFDWKISIWGNSGVFYRVPPDAESAWQTSPELQIFDDANHPYAREDRLDYSSGALLGLYPPAEDAVRPTGEWNRARIIARGPRVEHWLNGRKIVDYKRGSDDWNDKISRSKFNALPEFAAADRGHIVLQDHESEVWFRDISITPLGENSPTR